MKPLELTIHPRLEDTNLSPEDIRQGRWTELRMRNRKRFTDTELAAEYWEHRYGNEVASGWASDYSIIKQARERLEVIGRFARLPHFDEVSL